MLRCHLPGNLRISVARTRTALSPGDLWRRNECETLSGVLKKKKVGGGSHAYLVGAEGEDAIQIFN